MSGYKRYGGNSSYYSHERGNIVIKTSGYGVGEGFACEITLPNGKLYYTGISSMNQHFAEKKGWKTRTVRFYGACISCNLQDRATDKHFFPIQIDNIDLATYKDKLASREEINSYFKELTDSIHFVYKGEIV